LKQINQENEFACRICKASNWSSVWNFGQVPYGDLYQDNKADAIAMSANELHLVRCLDCKLLQLLSNTDIEAQYVDYLYSTSVTNALSGTYREISERLISLLGLNEKSLVLDIGSNDGTFLEFFKTSGVQVVGIDPAKNSLRLSNQRGIETISDFFTKSACERVLKEFGEPELISVNYTLANILDLSDFFTNIKSISTRSTVISIITGYHPDQFSVNQFEYIDHDHITYLTLRDFDSIAKKFGFKVIQANRLEHKGGSLHVLLADENSDLTVSSSVAQIRQREKWLRTEGDELFYNMLQKLQNIKNSLLSFFQVLANENKNILGIGASISTTYFLNFFELENLNCKLFDDDKSKHGKFCPRYGFEVYPLVEAPLEKGDNVCVIFAWQHTDRLMDRLIQLGYEGLVVIPLPHLSFRWL